MSESERNPWDRQPGETVKAYKAFKAYRDLGDRRSYAQLAHDLGRGTALRPLMRWSKDWTWKARIQAWDDHVATIEQAARDRALRETADRWARRQIEAAERAWDEAGDLLKWVDDALQTAKRTGSIGTIVKVLQAAGVIRERAVALALHAVNGADNFDPTTASPDELKAYLLKRGVKAGS